MQALSCIQLTQRGHRARQKVKLCGEATLWVNVLKKAVWKIHTSASASTWEARVWLQFFLPSCRGEINFRDLRKTWAVAASHGKAQQVTLVFYLGKKAKQLSRDEILQTSLSVAHSHHPSFHPSTALSGHAGSTKPSSKFQKQYSNFHRGRTDLFYSVTWQNHKIGHHQMILGRQDCHHSPTIKG